MENISKVFASVLTTITVVIACSNMGCSNNAIQPSSTEVKRDRFEVAYPHAVVAGQKIQCETVVDSNLRGDVVLEAAAVSCGCTNVYADGVFIEIGATKSIPAVEGSVELKCEIDTANKSKGENIFSVELKFRKHSETSMVRVDFVVSILQGWVFEPKIVELVRGETIQVTVYDDFTEENVPFDIECSDSSLITADFRPSTDRTQVERGFRTTGTFKITSLDRATNANYFWIKLIPENISYPATIIPIRLVDPIQNYRQSLKFVGLKQDQTALITFARADGQPFSLSLVGENLGLSISITDGSSPSEKLVEVLRQSSETNDQTITLVSDDETTFTVEFNSLD